MYKFGQKIKNHSTPSLTAAAAANGGVSGDYLLCQPEKLPFTFILYFVARENSETHLIIHSSMPYACNFDINLLCGSLSNAFSKSL